MNNLMSDLALCWALGCSIVMLVLLIVVFISFMKN